MPDTIVPAGAAAREPEATAGVRNDASDPLVSVGLLAHVQSRLM